MKRSKKLATLFFAVAIAVMGLIQLNTQAAYAIPSCCDCQGPGGVCACGACAGGANLTTTCTQYVLTDGAVCFPQ